MPKLALSVAAQSQNARAVRTAGNELSRRHLLAATGAAALAGTSTATAEAAAPHPDAELLAMEDELMRLWEAERSLPKDASDNDIDAAHYATVPVIDRIAITPASTTEGLKVKALAFLWCGHEPGESLDDLFDVPSVTSDTKLALSIVGDLTRDVSPEVRRLATWRAA